MILIERLKVLINEKNSFIKKELKTINESKRLSINNQSLNNKSGDLLTLKNIIQQTRAEAKSEPHSNSNLITMNDKVVNKEYFNNIKKVIPDLINRFSVNSNSTLQLNYQLEKEEEKEKTDSNHLNNNNNINPPISESEYYDQALELNYEEDKSQIYKIDSSKHFNQVDLNSEIQSHKFIDEISDCTSMTSNTSAKDTMQITGNEYKLNISSNQKEKEHKEIKDPKRLYQDFIKIFLKVKFEKLHNTHKGWEIPEKILFKECIKQGVNENDWSSFILSELQQPQKYTQYFKSNNTLRKNKMNKNIGTNLDIIKEENAV